MEGKHRALLLLTCLALLVTSVNGIVDLGIKLQQTFRASAVSDYGERLSIKVRCSSGRPSYAWWLAWSTLKATCSWNPTLWRLAWRVGSQVVSTVENAVTIQVSGSNIESPVTVDYWIEARKPDGTVLGKTLQASGISCNVGGSVSDGTGSIDIDQHLSDLGLSTTEDQTVDYYVYVKVTAVGLISGQQLVVEIGPVEFDSVTYDYGSKNWVNRGYWDTADITDVGIEDRIILYRAPKSASISYKATVKSISAYLVIKDGYDGGKVKCALYEYISSEDAGQLIASTEELTVPAGPYEGWFTFNFTGNQPEIELDKYYYIAIWGEDDKDGVRNLKIAYNTATDIDKGLRVDRTYGAWPSELTNELAGYDRDYCLYYTAVYYDWSASWSWYPLPLSVVSLPIGRQLFWGLVIGLSCFAAIVKLTPKRRGGGRKR